MSTLFGKPPKMKRTVESRKLKLTAFDASLRSYLPESDDDVLLNESVTRVLSLPAVGSKSFLITIGDRTVTGLIIRDQMVGPWQVPVADVAVTATALVSGCRTGESMAMGERPTLALISPAASARMAVAESLLNLIASDIQDGLGRVRLSANWMAPANHPGEGAGLYEAVEAIGLDLCPKLGVSIPVGKDSMSMKMKWTAENGQTKEVTAPISLVVTAFAAVEDIHATWTPQLKRADDQKGESNSSSSSSSSSISSSKLVFIDLANRNMALGGSALAQVYNQVGDSAPDVRDVEQFKAFFTACREVRKAGIVNAYHDRSDGGLFTTVVEMAFAGRVGISVDLADYAQSSKTEDVVTALFNEELGAVFNVDEDDVPAFTKAFTSAGVAESNILIIGSVTPTSKGQAITFTHGCSTQLFSSTRGQLQQTWATTSHHMQRIRDNPICADSEFASILSDTDPGLSYKLPPNFSLSPSSYSSSSSLTTTMKPRVAILREQGINSHSEMAFAFAQAGFTPIDVHMTDLLSTPPRTSLSAFTGLAACGGFSYGDVLGAGAGWAHSVLLHASTRTMFAEFFARKDTFALGVCNGCQFFSRLKMLIPGASDWPGFERNESEQYEARMTMVSVSVSSSSSSSSSASSSSESVFMRKLAGATIPIAVAHGEGRAVFEDPRDLEALEKRGGVVVRYVDNSSNSSSSSSNGGGGGAGDGTEMYPMNPNGSPHGVAGVISRDGRVLAMMPHPERTVLAGTGSWVSDEVVAATVQAGEGVGVWAGLFRSVREWVN